MSGLAATAQSDEDVLERFPAEPIDRDNIDYYRALLHHDPALDSSTRAD